MSAREQTARRESGLPDLDRRSLAFAIERRATDIIRAAKTLSAVGHRWPELSRRDLETLDRIDMELERLKLQLQRVAE